MKCKHEDQNCKGDVKIYKARLEGLYPETDGGIYKTSWLCRFHAEVAATGFMEVLKGSWYDSQYSRGPVGQAIANLLPDLQAERSQDIRGRSLYESPKVDNPRSVLPEVIKQPTRWNRFLERLRNA